MSPKNLKTGLIPIPQLYQVLPSSLQYQQKSLKFFIVDSLIHIEDKGITLDNRHITPTFFWCSRLLVMCNVEIPYCLSWITLYCSKYLIILETMMFSRTLLIVHTMAVGQHLNTCVLVPLTGMGTFSQPSGKNPVS